MCICFNFQYVCYISQKLFFKRIWHRWTTGLQNKNKMKEKGLKGVSAKAKLEMFYAQRIIESEC